MDPIDFAIRLAWLSAVLVAMLSAVLGSWVARQCGRSPLEGVILGLLFGPFGVILEALLPRR